MEPEERFKKRDVFTSVLTKEHVRREQVVTITDSTVLPAHCKTLVIAQISWKIPRKDEAVMVLHGVMACLGRQE